MRLQAQNDRLGNWSTIAHSLLPGVLFGCPLLFLVVCAHGCNMLATADSGPKFILFSTWTGWGAVASSCQRCLASLWFHICWLALPLLLGWLSDFQLQSSSKDCKVRIRSFSGGFPEKPAWLEIMTLLWAQVKQLAPRSLISRKLHSDLYSKRNTKRLTCPMLAGSTSSSRAPAAKTDTSLTIRPLLGWKSKETSNDLLSFLCCEWMAAKIETLVSLVLFLFRLKNWDFV